MVEFQDEQEERGQLEGYDEEYRKDDKQVCLHTFLSKRNALYYLAVQRMNGMYFSFLRGRATFYFVFSDNTLFFLP